MTKLITETNRYILGVLLIITVTLILGTIPVAVKQAMTNLSPATLLAIRFTIAAMILTPFVRKLNINLVRDGAIIGLLVFVVFATATIGLETISANRASFFFSLNMVFVTLFELVFRKRLSVRAVLAATLAFTGIGVMSWESGEPVSGEFWLLGFAVCSAAYIIVLEVFSSRHSPVPFTIIQVWVVAALSLLWAAPELSEQLEAIQTNLGVLIYLGVFATAIIMLLQVVAQRWISAQEAALLFALEPVFGATFAFLLLGETFTTRGFIGAAMVLVGIIVILSNPKIDESDSELPQVQESTNLDCAAKSGKVLVEVAIANVDDN
ncbi:DMT family transporter [Brasilonema sp. UFV-L1]|uniref:DMT family transporter n=1 Tax=Brasilonema sp. UFV-L1 TaxID=2234130 RepID=UPI00145DB320|nr:DMT family transporter [Brasilonema sp. UFV-L1]NMG06724.1 EamA family transporter [Brasilonema sp. UFV-L1]